jgi:SpoVK/Ycf46/Vps4 family AAA+-type ATPase/intein/homing endonuclease
MIERKPNPTDAKTYYQLGNDYYEKSDYEKAVENYNMAILLNPVFSEAYFNRALSYYQVKNFDKSVADYTKSAELDPQNPIIYNNRGDAFYRKQDFQTAIKDYDKAISLNPNYLKAFYNRGLSYASIEEYEKAVEDFTKVISIKDDFAEAYHLRGLAYEYAGNIGDAVADYEKALELNPDLTEAKTHLEGARAKKEQDGKGEGGKGADIKMLQKPDMNFEAVAGMKKTKEEIRESIVYPMMNPDLARRYGKLGGGGILMYGPPGCGKCLTGDGPVLLADGSVKEIKDIYSEAVCKGKKKLNSQETIIEQPGLTVHSLNKDTLKIEPKNVDFVYRQKYKGKVYEITTHSGRQITVTPEHPFIAIENGAKKVKASQIQEGAYIAIPRSISNLSLRNINKIVPEGFRLDEDGMIQYISKKHPHTRAIKPVYEINGEIARFFGCMLSEGASIYGTMFFSNSDQELIEDVSHVAGSQFGIDPRIKPDTSPGVQKVEIGSVTLMRFLEKMHDFKLRGSRLAKVPSSIMNAELHIVKQFLSAVFECEATVRKNVPEIEFGTSSKEFANGISYLLLRFGIVARIKPKKIKGNDHTYWRIYISSDSNLKRFEEKIGFICSKKIDALRKWTRRDIKENTNTDIIPNIQELLRKTREKLGLNKKQFYRSKNGYRYELGKNLSRDYLSRIERGLPENKATEKLRTLCESEVLWDEVVEVKVREIDDYVYDLTVEDNHTFIAGFGGLIVHNTYIVKAAAGECSAGFINAKLSDLLDMYVGNTEKNIHKVFELARKNSPAILFFDEIDAIGGRRDQQEGAQYMKMAVNQMLYEMDGVEAHNQNVLVIAATNAPWDVDPALRRSGRFSKALYISEPDYDSRVAILKIHSKKRPVAPLVPFRLLGLATMGYASADLKAIVEEAATFPWREAFFNIQKKAEKYIAQGMSKEEAEAKAKKEIYQRPINVADFVKAIMKKKSSLPPWYGQAKKQIGKQEEVTIIDGKEHKKVTDSKMGPAEKEVFKDLLSVINSKSQGWHKFLYGIILRGISIFILQIYTLIMARKLVLTAK